MIRRSLAGHMPIVLVALAALAVAPGNPRAASPGLPFTEDFANDALKDPGLTTAAWTPAGATFSDRRRLFGIFVPPYSGSDITADVNTAASVALGDVDGDGDLDLVVGNNGAPSRLYRNNGTATPFSGVTGTDITTDVNPAQSVALGDVDGDGDLDLVIGNYGARNRLYLNNGTATPFSGVTGTDITTDSFATTEVALGDVDGDGDLDLVAGNNFGPNRLYLNNGTANPFNGVTGTDITSDNVNHYSVALGDIDGDGDLDLVSGNNGSPSRFYLNNGTSNPFNGATGTDIAGNLGSTTVALGDIDGDGQFDLLVGNAASPSLLYLNNGTALPFAGVPGTAIPSDISIPFGERTSVALGDMDGDGHLDVVSARPSQTARLYLNNGSTNPFDRVGGEAITADVNNSSITVAVGDMDGDGDLDVVTGNSAQTNRLYLNNGTAHPFAGVLGTDITADNNGTVAVAVGDVDGDGDLDVVAGNFGIQSYLYLNNGTANPFTGVTSFIINNAPGDTESVALGDMDGDGDLDLVIGNNARPNQILLNNGTANPFFGVTGSDITSDNDSTTSVALGDVDGDGDLDLVTGNYLAGFTNRLYLNNGTANPFLGVSGSDITTDANGGVTSVALADVDGDGDLDFIAGHRFSPLRL